MQSRNDNLRILFIHHSTGQNLIRQGGVRNLIAQRNKRDGTAHEFWDHDYNEIGLTDPSGERTGISFNIPDDDTDPIGYDRLFSQPVHNPPDNALSHILKYDVVIFKSCFPVSAVHSRPQLQQYQQHYASIRDTLKRYPHILFIVVTQPPLVPQSSLGMVLGRSSRWMWTNDADAVRAREFSHWLTSQDFLMGLPNATTFDLFDLLAEPASSPSHPNTLRAEYRSGRLGYDAHPNEAANKAIAPIFVNAIWDRIKRFQQSITRDMIAVP